jgi:hypothetical protein
MIYLHSGVHVICLNGSLVKLCQNKSYIYGPHVHCVAILRVYTTKEYILTDLNIIQDYYHKKVQNPTLSSTSVVSAAQIHKTAILEFLTVGN